MYRLILCLGAIKLLFYPIIAANLPVGFSESLLADSLNPVAMTIDHHGGIWIAEKHGEVLILDPSGHLYPDPFIQIAVDDYNERGLLGIALHPNFDLQPYVYLYYTVPGTNRNRISRFLANGNLAVPGSEEVLFELDSLVGFVHNGGAMLFGWDGKLYVATGEAAYPPFSQDLNSLHGKILRLNPDGTIPNDNPFFHQLSGQNRAIWAYGLRNPFAFALSQSSGEFYGIDVGGGEYEEINILLPGKNYGWPIVEGPSDGETLPADYEEPLYAYSHNWGCSIVGAAFNELFGSTFSPNYLGHFFFADYCAGYIKTYNPISGTVQLFADQINRPLAVAFSQETGKMYYLTRAGLGGGSPADNTATNQGQLWEVSFTGQGSPKISQGPNSTLIPLGENAYFEVLANGAQTLRFDWYMNDQLIQTDTNSYLTVFAPALTDSGNLVYCIVHNFEGADTSEVAVLGVTANQRPVPVIESPFSHFQFAAGDTIFFKGKAIDPEEGKLSNSQLNWDVVWHHDAHTHPGAGTFSGIEEGFWVVPTVNETDTNVWYRIHLTATDSKGMRQKTFLDIHPQISHINLIGPSGTKINIDGRIRRLPYKLHSMVGLHRVIKAQRINIVGDSLFRFMHWSNGLTDLLWQGPAPRDSGTLELNYQSFVLGNGDGLTGNYFNDSTASFQSPPVMTRLDSILIFLWGDSSPEPELVDNDFFSVRWTGEIQAVFTEAYTFHLRTDDGVRLWIGNQLLVDQWQAQAPTAYKGTLVLEKGKRYPFKLEYFEQEGGAEMVLEWSSPSTNQEPIPFRQLYSSSDNGLGYISGAVGLDKNNNLQLDTQDNFFGDLPILLKSKIDSSIVQQAISDSEGRFILDSIAPGEYFIQALYQTYTAWLRLGSSDDLFGQTSSFKLASGDSLFVSLPFQMVAQSWFIPFPNLHVAPIPTSSRMTLSFWQSTAQLVQVRILNARGQQILHEQRVTQAGENNWEYSLEAVPVGLYLIEIRNEKGEGGTLRILKI